MHTDLTFFLLLCTTWTRFFQKFRHKVLHSVDKDMAPPNAYKSKMEISTLIA